MVEQMTNEYIALFSEVVSLIVVLLYWTTTNKIKNPFKRWALMSGLIFLILLADMWVRAGVISMSCDILGLIYFTNKAQQEYWRLK